MTIYKVSRTRSFHVLKKPVPVFLNYKRLGKNRDSASRKAEVDELVRKKIQPNQRLATGLELNLASEEVTNRLKPRGSE